MPYRQKYEDTPRSHASEGLLHSSDSDALSVEEGKEWSAAGFLGPRQSQGHGPAFLIREYWRLITTGLLVAIVGLQLFIVHEIRVQAEESQCTQVGGDYLKEGPTFDTKVVQWKADYHYVPLNATQFLDPKVRAKWESDIPVGAGFGPDELVYNSTSVTHQLHCVYIMGKIFSAVLTKAADIPEPEDYERHFLHCVDYMRQAAMCAGDVTVEPRGENGKPGLVDLVNAFHGNHVCKDYSQVKSYLEGELNAGRRNILPLDD